MPFLCTDFNNGFRFPPRVPFLHFDDDLFRDEKWSFFPSSSCGEGLLFNCPSCLKFLPFEKKFFRLSYILMLGGECEWCFLTEKLRLKESVWMGLSHVLNSGFSQKVGHWCWRHKMLAIFQVVFLSRRTCGEVLHSYCCHNFKMIWLKSINALW